ncbi:MAG TPA: TIGR04013 family B12-binding domain/radical SAM domain-containing protein [bacterium]|nr:TIGR04013 family B12-binding domain/radical SAM domain-containing protein [bacterium]
MKTLSNLRFTFVADSRNRTAVACLVAALEGLAEVGADSIRVARPAEALSLPYGEDPSTLDILGMTAMTEGMPGASRLLARIIEHTRVVAATGSAPLVTICGGPHPTSDPESALDAGFDYCCVGEGEGAIRGLAKTLARGDRVRSGRDGRILRSETLLDLDSVPALPQRFVFRGYIEIARGCRWACAYCQNPEIFGHQERFRSPASVEETVRLYAARGMQDIRLLAPNALGYRAEAERVPNCEALDDLLHRIKSAAPDGRIFFGSFPSEMRPDYVTSEAITILKRYVSNRRLVIGGQAGSQRVLDLIGRAHTVEDIVRASEIVAACGFQPLVDLMVGFPFEEPEDREATLALITRLRPANARFTMHFFMPLPGTRLAGARPRFLSEAERRHIDGLAQQGLIRGRWRRQEEFARRSLIGH